MKFVAVLAFLLTSTAMADSDFPPASPGELACANDVKGPMEARLNAFFEHALVAGPLTKFAHEEADLISMGFFKSSAGTPMVRHALYKFRGSVVTVREAILECQLVTGKYKIVTWYYGDVGHND